MPSQMGKTDGVGSIVYTGTRDELCSKLRCRDDYITDLEDMASAMWGNLTERQRAVLEFLSDGEWRSMREVEHAAGVRGASVLTQLCQRGLVKHGWPPVRGLAAGYKATRAGNTLLRAIRCNEKI